MNMKMLFVINDEERKLKTIVNKYHLPFNIIMYGDGTASQGILDFLDLVKTKKNILISIITGTIEKKIFSYLSDTVHLEEIGKGIAFTIPLSSSSKYVMEAFKKEEGEIMDNKKDYHLIVTVTNEGSAEKVMNIAKKNGANGGTLLKGRDVGGKSNFKFFNMTIEPEKDILLIVCHNNDKNKIMTAILEKEGIKSDAKSMCFSLPIDNIVGVNE